MRNASRVWLDCPAAPPAPNWDIKGSPGASCMMQNETTVTPNRVGIISKIRLRIYVHTGRAILQCQAWFNSTGDGVWSQTIRGRHKPDESYNIGYSSVARREMPSPSQKTETYK